MRRFIPFFTSLLILVIWSVQYTPDIQNTETESTPPSPIETSSQWVTKVAVR